MIEEINTRLSIEIPHFNLTRRKVVIDRLMYDGAAEQIDLPLGVPLQGNSEAVVPVDISVDFNDILPRILEARCYLCRRLAHGLPT